MFVSGGCPYNSLYANARGNYCVKRFIYDHVRTPRGKGRPDGALHEVSSVNLASQVLRALADRNELDTAELDDVILGCAQPVGEQGGNIARGAVVEAGYAQSVAGQQVHRFCASALEAVNNAAAQIMSGQSEGGHRWWRRIHVAHIYGCR